jgi:hypothetical protein
MQLPPWKRNGPSLIWCQEQADKYFLCLLGEVQGTVLSLETDYWKETEYSLCPVLARWLIVLDNNLFPNVFFFQNSLFLFGCGENRGGERHTG